jgi:hypothetical protein
MSLKPLLAAKTAEMVGFSVVGNFELGGCFVKHHAANWVSKH